MSSGLRELMGLKRMFLFGLFVVRPAAHVSNG